MKPYYDDGRGIQIYHGDNLVTLRRLADEGARFDLVELDGPYGAGLEGWDCLTEAEYVAHYAERLTLVRDVLQPWGVVFVFGYPEMVAEIKAWAHATKTLHCRRWLHWYNNQAAHAGRRVQVIAVFVPPIQPQLWRIFQVWLRTERKQRGLTIEQCHQMTGIRPYARGGYLWFESPTSDYPDPSEYEALDSVFRLPTEFYPLQSVKAFDGATDIDFLSVPVERAESLNDAGLRSKPVGLYDTLFRPVVPPRPATRALVLYGGSGNAAIAAARLGYAVDVCETDATRCDLIRRRYAWHVHRRDETPVNELGPLFGGLE